MPWSLFLYHIPAHSPNSLVVMGIALGGDSQVRRGRQKLLFKEQMPPLALQANSKFTDAYKQ
jgi:hypothetical protein